MASLRMHTPNTLPDLKDVIAMAEQEEAWDYWGDAKVLTTPPTLHFAIMADTLKHGLEQQIEQFLTDHPDTKLVVIDTLQRVRSAGSDSNLYANDYQDIGLLKKLADKRHIAILLIHHLRKLHDDDPMNMISGSTGLSGAADSTFVLQKSFSPCQHCLAALHRS